MQKEEAQLNKSMDMDSRDQKGRSLDPEEMRAVAERLLERKRELWSEIRDDLENDLSGEYQNLVQTIKDHVDDAMAELMASTALSLVDLKARELQQIEAALRRMEEGGYGRCEDCGRRIRPERLKALPYSTRCLECQARWERTQGVQ
jgi:DnaK suppressor protein